MTNPEKLYHDLLLDHYRHPRHRGPLSDADFSVTIFNPLCGDEITVHGKIQNGLLIGCSFEGKGCVISQAAASLLLESVQGKSVADIAHLTTHSMLQLINLTLGPTRLRCGLLALEALQKGVSHAASGKTP